MGLRKPLAPAAEPPRNLKKTASDAGVSVFLMPEINCTGLTFEQCGPEHMRRPAPRLETGPSRLLARFMHARAAHSFEVSHRLALDEPLVVLPAQDLADVVRRLSSSSAQLRRPTPSGRAGRARRSGRCGSCGRATASHDQLGLNGAERLVRMPSSRALMLRHVSRARSGPRLGDHG